MEDMTYTARLVVSAGYQDRLDMSINCENAQQLLRARNTISDQLNTYIAEFAIQSGLNAMPAKDPNGEALQEVIEESVEKAKAAAEETEDPDDESGEDAVEEPQTEESAPAPEPPPLAAEDPKPPQVPEGAKGLMKLKCKGCGDNFVAFLRERQVTWVCRKCGYTIPLTNTALFEFDCPTCGRHAFGRTNIEDADFTFPCGGCGTEINLTWNRKARRYTME